MSEFILKTGSLQDQFLKSTAKFQIYGGGYGNGKTTALVIKILEIAKAYPGSSGLAARSTYPKLNDTLRKEFIKWCPKEWIKSFPVGQNGSNVCTLKNGSTITFRYISQQGKGTDGGTSNLLSANYDYIAVDQLEDPEIVHKDFLDLLGRLRGSTRIEDEREGWPLTGPRWILLTCNPTANWVYTKLVRPIHIYKRTGVVSDDLLCERDVDRQPLIDDNGKVRLRVALFEGSTYELRHIHEADGGDFIQTLEEAYTGQMRARFLEGKWASYEGLVYPQYDVTLHGLRRKDIEQWLERERGSGYEPRWVEGYDFGQTSPSCYLLGAVTSQRQVIVVDGFHRAEFAIEDQVAEIKRIRAQWLLAHSELEEVDADPSIFTQKTVSKRTVGKSIARMFEEEGIMMRRGNNDIMNGIVKVQGYLRASKSLMHPVINVSPAPRLFHNIDLVWLSDEFGSYYWMSNGSGGRLDKPVDANDHAMDTLKYLLSTMPNVGTLHTPAEKRVPDYMKWQDAPTNANNRNHRYG